MSDMVLCKRQKVCASSYQAENYIVILAAIAHHHAPVSLACQYFARRHLELLYQRRAVRGGLQAPRNITRG
eukprot:scaffold326659_cov50-Prasinocladus_malaysianus.AAC.1